MTVFLYLGFLCVFESSWFTLIPTWRPLTSERDLPDLWLLRLTGSSRGTMFAPAAQGGTSAARFPWKGKSGGA